MTSHLRPSRLAAPQALRGPHTGRSRRAGGGPTPLATWERSYVRAAVATDVVAVVVMVVVGNVLGLGAVVPPLGDVAPGVGLVAGVLLVFGLVIARAWDPRVLGHGAEEFSRLIRAVVTAAGVLGLLGLALEATAARPWVFGLIPAAGMLAVLFRLGLRQLCYGNRDRGRCLLAVLAVGDVDSLVDLIDRTRHDVRRGWVVSGVCTPKGVAPDGGGDMLGVPVVGDLDAVADAVRGGGYRVVAICPTPGWTSRRLHQLAWDIDDRRIDLVVNPGLVEVAGPRLHVESVDGLPFLRVTRPLLTGVSLVTKHLVDRLGAAVLLVLLGPVLLAAAVAVKLDGGPVLSRETRVGRHGREFSMLRFRSTADAAAARRAQPAPACHGSASGLWTPGGPEVTRVGAVLRRYSLDELPQLFNVLSGTMSLVGPRPALPAEVATYGVDAQRTLTVKPGLSGLWQISGRSEMTWEQSVRLDLRYVENWNLALDAEIVWKTVGSVLTSRDAE